MSENTENTAGAGMSPEMASKLEALGVSQKNVSQTPAMQELGNAVSERMSNSVQEDANVSEVQPTQQVESQQSYADQILNTPEQPVKEQAQQQAQVSESNTTSVADDIQASQNPANDSDYYKLDSELFGGEMKIGSKETNVEEKPKFNGFEDFTPFIKEEFGFEKIDDFVDSYKKLREIENDFNSTSNQLEKVRNDINSLPPDITDAIQAWAKGDDYTKVFEKKRLNYNLEPNDLGSDKLIQHYFPEEFKTISSEDFQDRLNDGDVIAKNYVQRLYSDSEQLFRNEKETVKTRASEQLRMAEERGKKFDESVLNAMNEFDKKYPNSTRVYRDKVHKALRNRELESLLYNPDGTYTNRAAEFYIEMTQGPDLRNQLIKQVEERAVSRANEEILMRQSGQSRIQNSAGAPPEISEAVQNKIDEIRKGSELSKNYY